VNQQSEPCDRTLTIEDMEREVGVNFSAAKEHHVIKDIKQTLDLFVSKGIIDKTAY
jgi:hypothetical protein